MSEKLTQLEQEILYLKTVNNINSVFIRVIVDMLAELKSEITGTDIDEIKQQMAKLRDFHSQNMLKFEDQTFEMYNKS